MSRAHRRVRTSDDLRRIEGTIDEGWRLVAPTTGCLSEREARSAHSPAGTDPDLRSRGQTPSYDDFVANLETAGVLDRVEIKRAFSYDLAREWKDPIRFLWIDGDHAYRGAKTDIDMFKPFFADGAIVAMHDVVGTFEGLLRVFVEEVLDRDGFGPAGFSGSIGWAQYRPRDGARFRWQRLLAIPGRKSIPVARRADKGLHGWNRFLIQILEAAGPTWRSQRWSPRRVTAHYGLTALRIAD